jgi:hypothetical protein
VETAQTDTYLAKNERIDSEEEKMKFQARKACSPGIIYQVIY